MTRELQPGSKERPTREERLAAKLRENLRRRKEQARAQSPVCAPRSSQDDAQ